MEITDLLKHLADHQGSDLYLSSGAPPHMKVEGRMVAIEDDALTPSRMRAMARALMSAEHLTEFERELELNMAVQLPDTGRFRVNVFRQRGEMAMVIRNVRSDIPSIAALQLPKVLEDVIMAPRGLVLVVGSTGSGKSTTLASMIDHRNRHHRGHVLTIEDPIEFVHQHRMSLVNQREVGLDTHSYHEALKNAMREAPDVILIGEIRDTPTMEAAISFAETGHLCLATLHANNTDQAVERILNFFPEGAHRNVLMNLSLNLQAVIGQRLVLGTDGRRLPATEVMINTPLVRDLMRRGDVHEIKRAMEESLQDGMESFDQSLFRLHKQGRIELDEALDAADSRDGLALKFRLSEGASELHDPYAEAFAPH
ncbi:MAG: PilT/PilU family type 4a pilus ATPase [Pseudoxanthomonas suwonensis]|nr:PilT/PilU family type 4a pilus ATPase [Pseudoxanthomonas suwonensis]